MTPDDERCVEFVDLITSYLDGALPEPARARVEEHLSICEAARPRWRNGAR